jgi:mono/diheme cytochrome c family protein
MVNEQVYGRPVDVAVGPDGALYLSDDFTGTIYRIAYGSRGAAPAAAAAAPSARATAAPDPLAGLDPTTLAAARARGERLWNDNSCISCHTTAQVPGQTYRPLTALRDKYTIDSLTALLRTPPPPMPPPPLNDEQRRDLAVYLLAVHP